jgi:protein involved in polysaccharide export with SLBB domain
MHRNSFWAGCLAAAVFMLAMAGSAYAQDAVERQIESSFDQERTRSRGALYYLTPDDEVAIRVNVWGFVVKPGQYVVPRSTNLIALMSYAGGPLQDAKLKSVRIIRDNPVSLAQLAAKTGDAKAGIPKDKQEVLVVNIKKYLSDGDESKIPQLMPGDTVVVPGSRMQSVSRVLDFAAKILIITQIYFYIQVAK